MKKPAYRGLFRVLPYSAAVPGRQELMNRHLRGGESIYHRMSRLAAEHGAANLSQGFPTLEGPAEVRECAARALRDGYQQYTDPRGTPALRQALASDVQRRYSVALCPESEVTVTAGAQDALACALLGLLEPGDEVVFIEPFYNPCVPVARRAGADLRFVPLRPPHFALDENELIEAMSERTKLVVYNSPNNPSGRVLSREELQMIARACERFDAYLIADEVYEHLVYDGHRHISAFDVPELRERAIVVSSFSKTFLMTGWRVGWALGAAPLVAAVSRMHSLASFCLPDFLCEGTRYALEDLPDSYMQEFVEVHQVKRDAIVRGLAEYEVEVLAPEGTFFCSVPIAQFGEQDDIELCERLPKEAGVAAVPMSLSWHERRFGRDLIRLCFSKDDETLERATHSLGQWAQKRRESAAQ